MSEESTSKATPFPAEPKGKRFSISTPTDEDLAAGRWETLPCGLEVRVAPPTTQEFFRASSALLKKHGGTKARRLENLTPTKQRAWSRDVITTAVFLAFRDPATGGDAVLINGEEWEDSLDTRRRMLAELPIIRKQLDDAIGDVAAAFEAEAEESAGN